MFEDEKLIFDFACHHIKTYNLHKENSDLEKIDCFVDRDSLTFDEFASLRYEIATYALRVDKEHEGVRTFDELNYDFLTEDLKNRVVRKIKGILSYKL